MHRPSEHSPARCLVFRLEPGPSRRVFCPHPHPIHYRSIARQSPMTCPYPSTPTGRPALTTCAPCDKPPLPLRRSTASMAGFLEAVHEPPHRQAPPAAQPRQGPTSSLCDVAQHPPLTTAAGECNTPTGSLCSLHPHLHLHPISSSSPSAISTASGPEHAPSRPSQPKPQLENVQNQVDSVHASHPPVLVKTTNSHRDCQAFAKHVKTSPTLQGSLETHSSCSALRDHTST